MSDELIEHLRWILQKVRCKKGDYLHKGGYTCRHIWFIESGIVRIYGSQGKKGVTQWIIQENGFVVGTDSFPKTAASKYTIVAEENTVAWCITIVQLHEAINLYREFDEHYKAIDGLYRKMKDDHFEVCGWTEKDRVEWLHKNHPGLLLRLKREILAGWLLMAVETFDRHLNGPAK